MMHNVITFARSLSLLLSTVTWLVLSPSKFSDILYIKVIFLQ